MSKTINPISNLYNTGSFSSNIQLLGEKKNSFFHLESVYFVFLSYCMFADEWKLTLDKQWYPPPYPLYKEFCPCFNCDFHHCFFRFILNSSRIFSIMYSLFLCSPRMAQLVLGVFLEPNFCQAFQLSCWNATELFN